MKKLFILAMAFGLAACSTDKTEMPEVGSGDVETNYLTVNLVATPSTRAVEDAANYEDGTETENTVTSVRFHFFKADGSAATVKSNGTESFLDWTAGFGDEGKETPNVEKILAAHLVIETPKGDDVPASIVAILNPTSAKTYATIGDLNKDVENYGITATNTSFVMSNSVYAKGGTKMEAVNVSDNLRSTAEAALASPVTIYVERVVAKTSLTVGLNPAGETAGVYETAKPESTNGAEDGKDYTFNGEKIYVKFLGWNVTCHTAKSRLMKEINAGWNSNLFGATEPWNYDPYFRSFWAINPTLKWMEKTAEDDWAEDTDYIFGSFNKTGDANRANAIEVGTSTYMQENASDATAGTNPAHPTQVIIAAQLCKIDGTPIEFAEYGFQQFALTNSDNKNPLIINYANIASLYTRVDSQDGDVTKQTYTKVQPEDLELKTATQVGKADALTDGRYYVYVQLKADSFAANKWTLSNADNSDYAATLAEINAELIKLGPAKVWTNGYTYYYFDIAHLGESNGSLGVVRNHVYKSNITKLVGLGTPVFDPNETIYPEKPENEDTYLAAQIKILSWRIVNNDVELNWE